MLVSIFLLSTFRINSGTNAHAHKMISVLVYEQVYLWNGCSYGRDSCANLISEERRTSLKVKHTFLTDVNLLIRGIIVVGALYIEHMYIKKHKHPL